MNIALFLPHLDVAGGLGVHCRMVLKGLAAVISEHTFAIFAPRDPAVLFPHVASEPFDRSGLPVDRFAFHPLEVPVGFNLASPHDPILAAPLAGVKPDVLYCSYYTGMARPPCRQIVAFHDAGFLENPAGFGATATIRRQTLEAIRPAIARIQCISFDARDRICRLLPWDQERTTVIWHALPDSPSAIEAAKTSSPLPGFERPYFFVPVGAATGFNRARKNVPTAVQAFRRLPPGTGRLIIAGTARLTEGVLAELLPAAETGTTAGEQWTSRDGAITILPTVSRADFHVLMRHAVAVVYPSRYEGFGLPTIEAMAVGTPLIAARATSIPEIVGEAGILIDPDDVAGMAVAMMEMATQPEQRRRLIARGDERVAAFGIDQFGQRLIEMVQNV